MALTTSQLQGGLRSTIDLFLRSVCYHPCPESTKPKTSEVATMASNETTKFKLSVSGFQLEYEGREALLQSEIPNLLLTTDKLKTSRLALPLARHYSRTTSGLFEGVHDNLQFNPLLHVPLQNFTWETHDLRSRPHRYWHEVGDIHRHRSLFRR